MMLTTTTGRIAFKEWAAVCQTLRTGRQIAIFRKGGIHEGREGFRVEHDAFWMFPTYEHQSREGLSDEAADLLELSQAKKPAGGGWAISLWAEVQSVVELCDESILPRLSGQHVYAPRTLDERFHYRTPGLFVLPVRVFRLPEPIVIPNSPHFAGCSSWVDLPDSIATDGVEPVLSDDEFAVRLHDLYAALSPSATA
ncbi:hypothetical protein CA54_29890 [Symmachiella macrocystis]|uniref:DUF1802 family protein n=1 Tax=Symmachiella macrocystis TaxID=2527985 RepID=A0A5C6BSE7_9PLAN|nr:DUF1802 family protein [Symmachiella macrocystis]TWU14146.1 hypothetical protein CA54_29890 [Symmachiella macrocystis]